MDRKRQEFDGEVTDQDKGGDRPQRKEKIQPAYEVRNLKRQLTEKSQ